MNSIRLLTPPALKDQKILVLGAGESGLAIAKWLHRYEAQVFIVDDRPNPPQAKAIHELGIKSHFGSFEETKLDLEHHALVVVSPGLPLTSPPVVAARKHGRCIVGEIELFVQGLTYLKPSAKLLGITGSNGKTTTVRLLELMLKQDQCDVTVAGNISPSALHQLLLGVIQQYISDVWILELSSFQLATLYSGMFTAAAVLNVHDNHQDWHVSFDDYCQTKQSVLEKAYLKIVNYDNRYTRHMVEDQPSTVFFSLHPPYDRGGCRHWYYCADDHNLYMDDCLMANRTDCSLMGSHNTSNILAAFALAHAVNVVPAVAAKALPHFTPLPHRCEWIANIAGVDYFNDSKSTTISSTQAALNGLQRKAVVILGGQGKQQDFTLLKPTLRQYAREIILIGEDASMIEKALQGPSNEYVISHASTLSKALERANEHAQDGDCIILSPACASLDMFSNYAQRGDQFRHLVKNYEKSCH